MQKVLNFIKSHKIISVIIVLVFIGIVGASGGSKPITQTAQTTKQTAPAATPTPQAAKPTTPALSYQTVETNTNYSAIVIPASYDNSADMTQLGQQLKDKAASKSFDRVYVFDNATAASYLDAELKGNATDAQNAVYDPHFVAIYQKNTSSGLNRFVVTLKGDQDPNPQTINY